MVPPSSEISNQILKEIINLKKHLNINSNCLIEIFKA